MVVLIGLSTIYYVKFFIFLAKLVNPFVFWACVWMEGTINLNLGLSNCSFPSKVNWATVSLPDGFDIF